MSKSFFYYREKMPQKDQELAGELISMGKSYPRLGSKKLSAIFKRKNKKINHKTIERVRKKLGLTTKRRRSRKLIVEPLALPKVSLPNELWSIDFVHDKLNNYVPFRCFTCVDVVDRQSPGILVQHSIKASDVITFLEGIGRYPKGIVLDNGTEFRSEIFENWCANKEIKLHFIEKGMPTQNGYVESFNGKFRHECLSLNNFGNIGEAKKRIEKWRNYYNTDRPHGSIKMMTPYEYSNSLQAS